MNVLMIIYEIFIFKYILYYVTKVKHTHRQPTVIAALPQGFHVTLQSYRVIRGHAAK